jgi:hypothetical protein
MKMTTVAFAMALLFGLVVGATDASAHAHLRIVSPSVGLKTLAHGTYTVVSMQVYARGWRIVVPASIRRTAAQYGRVKDAAHDSHADACRTQPVAWRGHWRLGQ